jgi:very-short-patch-repair endonuclease
LCLEAEGHRVLRFDVLSNMDGVLTEIHRALTTTLTPGPSPPGEGEKTSR